MAQEHDTTRDRLIAAAEHLFATKGIDGVSLREINRASGAKNAIAVQYHFEDRNGIVRAILAKHQPEVDARRHAMLDTFEAEGAEDLRALAGALVRPAATKLTDPSGGPAYLVISAELMNMDRPHVNPAATDVRTSIGRWRALAEPLLSPEALSLHRRFTAIRFSAIELGRRAGSGPHADQRLFVTHLVDLVHALLQAPVSDESRRLLARRGRKVQPATGR